jgi:cardiolipin synthase
MAAQYERDLARATEIVLTRRNRVSRTEGSAVPAARRARSGSAGRFAAGAVSMGSALGAALTNRRTLGAAEAGLLAKVSAFMLAFALVAALWPRVVAWPLSVLGAWVGIAWIAKAVALRRHARKAHSDPAGIASQADPVTIAPEAGRDGGAGP